MTTPDLTLSELRSLLHYDPETGVFTWLQGRRKGFAAGYVAPNGYVNIKIRGQKLWAHRLAWFYAYGRWPSPEIDHKNGRPSDNWLRNLRESSRAMNLQNRHRVRSNSTTGVMGVRKRAERSGYCAYITHRGKQIHLGSFDTAEAAHAAYLEAKARLHPGYVPQ